MNDPFPEELLSAYLDGELPREERARVDQWLAASADHRRLFDDLQTIRRELQALPHQALDAGFSDRVLAAIRGRADDDKGASLATTAEPSPGTNVPGATVPAKPVSLPPRRLGMPAWRWFAAGVAAALLAVIAGINAAPETMAQMGKLAQVRSAEQKTSGTNQAAEPPRSMPTAKAPAPGDTAGAALLPEASQASADGTARQQLEPGSLLQQDRQDMSADRGERRKEAAPGERAELEDGGAGSGAPTRMAAEAPAAPRAQLDEKDADADGYAETPAPPLAAALAAPPPAPGDGVAELPVTGQQADRALAYAMTIERESARRALSNVDTVQNLATNEYAAAKSFQEKSEAGFQRAAPGLSLIKLMDATAQGVQVSALEVTGSEADILSLLDSLGVEEARDLRPQAGLGGGGSGGTVGWRSFGRGENPRGGAEAKPAADSAANTEADGDLNGEANERAQAKGGKKTNGRGNASAAGLGGLSSAREQPQLRVRLVIVPPQADPATPAE